MDHMPWKTRLVVLWVLQILNFIAVLLIPESLATIVEEVGAALGPLIAFYFFLSGLMLWLTVFARPSVSRWPTMLVGVFYAFVKLQWTVDSLTGDMVVELFLTELWGLVAALLIVWYGWKSPKQDPAP
jgi:hypothetical protein